VLDWIKIEVELRRPTQLQHVRREVGIATGRSIWIKPVDPGSGGVDKRFLLTLQEPRLIDIVEHEKLLERLYGLTGKPKVVSLEVSVDFYPNVSSDEHRGRLVGVLSRHLVPKR